MTRAQAATRARRTPPQPTWYDVAKCRGKPHLFYPPPNESASGRALRERYASVVCASCPALEECREWAREQREFGFWGGESEAARTAAGFVPRSPGELRMMAAASRQPFDGVVHTVAH
jgi:WhiB family redox-sensing transcriptional regulator